METLTLKQANKIIIEQINESNLFNRPEIDFILFNDREETSQTLIGVHEQDNPSLSYIYILETNDNDIRHKYFSLKYYVVYCKKNGINYKLLNIYSKNELANIIGEFYLMYDEDDFFNILENFNWTIISTLFEENKKIINDYLNVYKHLIDKKYEY